MMAVSLQGFVQGRVGALYLMLLLFPVVTPAAADTTPFSLQPLAQWEVTGNQQARQNIFCKQSLGAVTRSTASAAQAVQALCNLHGSQDLFSSSALDSFMASRFVDPKVSLKSSYQDLPFSTEPNTPWMLADVVLTSSKEQKRAAASRKIRCDAQVDLFICSDPNCTALVDLVKLHHRNDAGNASSHWSMVTSGIHGRTFQMTVGTARGLTMQALYPQDSWLPQEYNKTAEDSVKQVVWIATRPTDRDYYQAGCTDSYRRVHVLPLATQARLASKDNSPWERMCIGHYKVGGMLATSQSPSVAHDRGTPSGCMTGGQVQNGTHSHGVQLSELPTNANKQRCQLCQSALVDVSRLCVCTL
jgi:hypothetical protein